MCNTFDSFTRRHPAAVPRLLIAAHLYVMCLPAATVLLVLAGHTLLAIVGVLALISLYGIGYATAAIRGRDQVAQARRDPLTGLPNRGLADDVLAHATRTATPVTVALADVDGLHMINVNLGMAAGDQYLRLIAQRLARAVPAGGVLVRHGGDEFSIIAPGTDAQQLATEIGAALAGPGSVGGHRVQPRASVGIAATHASESTDGTADAQHARARADAALYTAKRDGGNQIRIFDPDRDPEPSPDGTRPLLRRRDVNPIVEAGMVWLPTPGDELIPLLLAPDDLQTVAQALSSAAERWSRAGAEAAAGAGRPESARSSEPGWMNIEPTPAGYAGIASLAAGQQARYTRLLARLRPIIETTQTLEDAGHAPTPRSASASAMSCVVLVGISAQFTPADLEALVITAAEAVYGQPDELSSRQHELAARAYALLHDSIDG